MSPWKPCGEILINDRCDCGPLLPRPAEGFGKTIVEHQAQGRLPRPERDSAQHAAQTANSVREADLAGLAAAACAMHTLQHRGFVGDVTALQLISLDLGDNNNSFDYVAAGEFTFLHF